MNGRVLHEEKRIPPEWGKIRRENVSKLGHGALFALNLNDLTRL